MKTTKKRPCTLHAYAFTHWSVEPEQWQVEQQQRQTYIIPLISDTHPHINVRSIDCKANTQIWFIMHKRSTIDDDASIASVLRQRRNYIFILHGRITKNDGRRRDEGRRKKTHIDFINLNKSARETTSCVMRVSRAHSLTRSRGCARHKVSHWD